MLTICEFDGMKLQMFFQEHYDITISWPNGADLAPEFLYELEAENADMEVLHNVAQH